MAIPNEPIKRQEQYFAKIAGQESSLPEEPITRKEFYLAKAAGQDVETPEPITREERYLDAIAEGGGGGGGGSATLITKSVTQNGTYNASADNADGYSKVTVNVPNTYAAGDEGKVVSNGALVAQTSQTVTANGTYNTTTKNSVTVNVSPNTTTKTITENGTYAASSDNVDGYSSVTVNVSGSADPNAVARSILDGTITSYEDDVITTIRKEAFQGLATLTSVKCHNASFVGRYAFDGTGVTALAFTKTVSLDSDSPFNTAKNLVVLDVGSFKNNYMNNSALKNADKLSVFIIRSDSVARLGGATAFQNTPFQSGGSGGTIYILKSLYDHLGDGSNLDYKAATNWSTLDGYGTVTWAQIEGSYYETHYGDDTLIPTA